jgi:uncharacterized membrane protein YtjA (UPF0391 family)
MLRWITVLCVLTGLAGLVSFGVIPFGPTGTAGILLGVYAALLTVSLVVGLFRS